MLKLIKFYTQTRQIVYINPAYVTAIVSGRPGITRICLSEGNNQYFDIDGDIEDVKKKLEGTND